MKYSRQKVEEIRKRAVAIVYLRHENDDRHILILGSDVLYVVANQKITAFALQDIQDIFLSMRRWLVPLSAGGILASFCLLAIFTTLLNPWLLLTGVVAGLATFYVGFTQHASLAIIFRQTRYDFSIPAFSANLQAFINFVKSWKNSDMEQPNIIYHVAEQTEWEQAKSGGNYTPSGFPNDGFIHASTASQLNGLKKAGIFSTENQWVVLHIDTLKVKVPVKFEAPDHPEDISEEERQNLANDLFPHIYGALNTDAVVDTSPL